MYQAARSDDARPAMIECITYYDTSTHCYLFGSTSKSATSYHVATFTKGSCASAQATDELGYGMSDVALDAEAARQRVEKIRREEAVRACGRAIAVLGCVRFTCGYYLLLVTERRRIGSLAYTHTLYEISDVVWLALYDTTHTAATTAAAARTSSNSNSGNNNSMSSASMLLSGGAGTSASTAEGGGMSAAARLMSAAVPYLFKSRSSEDHYRAQFQENDLRHYFYYSPTYDLSNTMQANYTAAPCARRMKYIWNDFLLEPFARGMSASDARPEYCGMADYDFPPHVARWLVYCIHGAATQRSVAVQQDRLVHGETQPAFRQVTLTLIGRVSKEFTGARYLRRGVNGDGHVANHVEVEQMCCALLQANGTPGMSNTRGAAATAAADNTSSTPDVLCSSFVQVRGSVPLRWYHASSNLPRPPIRLGATDFCVTATCKHFQELLADYGGPVVVLDLLKQHERHTRESPLGHAYRRALDMLMSSTRAERGASAEAHGAADEGEEDDILCYRAIDLRALAERAWNVVTAAAEEDVRRTGFFACGSGHTRVRLQCGVVRANCVDCVDRTNIAQFLYGLHALGAQLQAMDVLHDAVDLIRSPAVQDVLLEMFLALGDAIAVQYGGSAQVGAGVLHRGAGWDQMMGMKRLYNNVVGDGAKQSMLNLFLGKYQPVPRPTSRALNRCMHPPRPYTAVPSRITQPHPAANTNISNVTAMTESGAAYAEAAAQVANMNSNNISMASMSPVPPPHLQAEESEEHQSRGTDTSLDSTVILDPLPSLTATTTAATTGVPEQLAGVAPARLGWRTTSGTSHVGIARELLANYITGRRRQLWGGPRPQQGLDEACADYYLHVRHAPALPAVDILKRWWVGPLAWHAMHSVQGNNTDIVQCVNNGSNKATGAVMEGKASATLTCTTARTSCAAQSTHGEASCQSVASAWQHALQRSTTATLHGSLRADMTGRTSTPLLLRNIFGATLAAQYAETDMAALLERTYMRDWVQGPRAFAHDVLHSLYARNAHVRQGWCGEDIRHVETYSAAQIVAYVLPLYGDCHMWDGETFATCLRASEPSIHAETLRAVRQAHMRAEAWLSCTDAEVLTEKVQTLLQLDEAAQLAMVVRFIQVLQQARQQEGKEDEHDSAQADMHSARDTYCAHYAQATCAALRPYFAAPPVLRPYNVADVLQQWRSCLCDPRCGVPRRHALRYTTHAIDSRRSSHIPDALIVPRCFSARTLSRWLTRHATRCGLSLCTPPYGGSSVCKGDGEDANSGPTRVVWRLMWWLVQAGWVIPVLRPARTAANTCTSSSTAEVTPAQLFADTTMLYQLTDTLDTHVLNPAVVSEAGQVALDTPAQDIVALSEVLARVALHCFGAVRSAAAELSAASAYRALVQPLLEQLATLAAGLRRCTLPAYLTTNSSSSCVNNEAAMRNARLVLLVNLYNALYVHAWLATSVQTAGVLSSDTITFYETNGYQVGQDYVTLSILKNAWLRGNLPPCYACHLPPTVTQQQQRWACDGVSTTCTTSGREHVVSQAKDALDAALVWSDAMATTRMAPIHYMTDGEVGSTGGGDEQQQCVSTPAEVRARALEAAHAAWGVDQRYVAQRVVLALLDTYIAPPCNVSPVANYDPEAVRTASSSSGFFDSSPLRVAAASRRKSESVLSASRSERASSLKSATSSSSTTIAADKGGGGGGAGRAMSHTSDTPRKEPWSTLGASQGTSRDMQAAGNSNISSNGGGGPAATVPLYFHVSDGLSSATTAAATTSGRAVEHLCLALQPTSLDHTHEGSSNTNNNMASTAEEQLREIAASFAFSMAHSSSPAALARMLQPLLSYPEVFGAATTQDARRALQDGQDAAHALRAAQDRVTQLL